MKEDVKKCIASSSNNPVDCYKNLFGAIKYTKDERGDWEKKMKDKNGYTFNPDNYPTTDMMEGDGTKK